MKQGLATLTVSLALLGLLTGSLLRPCDCGRGGGPAFDAASVGPVSLCAECCCGGNESKTRSEGEDQPGDDSRQPCCKPAPPAVEASSAVALAPPALAGAPAMCSPAPGMRCILVTAVRGAAGPPDCPPWRLSEEGLTVFLL